ncbi:MAG: hypothetical protein WC360_02230 [Opitutales bacterium]|jgi:Rod binding domain-containing protein
MQLTTASGDMGLDASEQIRRIKNMPQSEQIAKVAGQFESIFLRQFLKDSLKPMIKGCMGENSPGSDIYQSMIVDTIADGIQSGGGMGLSNVIQLQLQQSGAKGKASNAHGDA